MNYIAQMLWSFTRRTDEFLFQHTNANVKIPTSNHDLGRELVDIILLLLASIWIGEHYANVRTTATQGQ